ncbi:MAG: gamma-glutamylcyclotransferase family protein [Limnothrix sp.]
MTSSPLQVFVYGTLKPGGRNYPLFCEGRVTVACPALVQGKLYEIAKNQADARLSYSYPAMTAEAGWVEGLLLTFTDHAVLTKLDQLEDFQSGRSPTENYYERQWLTIYTLDKKLLTEAWGYVMSRENVQTARGIALNSTNWQSG